MGTRDTEQTTKKSSAKSFNLEDVNKTKPKNTGRANVITVYSNPQIKRQLRITAKRAKLTESKMVQVLIHCAYNNISIKEAIAELTQD